MKPPRRGPLAAPAVPREMRPTVRPGSRICADPSHKSGACPKLHDCCPMCGKAYDAHRRPCPNGGGWFEAMERLDQPAQP